MGCQWFGLQLTVVFQDILGSVVDGKLQLNNELEILLRDVLNLLASNVSLETSGLDLILTDHKEIKLKSQRKDAVDEDDEAAPGSKANANLVNKVGTTMDHSFLKLCPDCKNKFRAERHSCHHCFQRHR